MRGREHSSARDEEMVKSGATDVVEWVRAVRNVAKDGFVYLEPDIARLLEHENLLLRAVAVEALVFWWERPEHLDKAFEMLAADPESRVRRAAGSSIAMFSYRHPEVRPRAIRAFLARLDDPEIDDYEATGMFDGIDRLRPEAVDRTDIGNEISVDDVRRRVDRAGLEAWLDSTG